MKTAPLTKWLSSLPGPAGSAIRTYPGSITSYYLSNTVLLGFADYGNVYTDPSDCNKPLGDLDPRGSLCNKLLLGSEEPLA